METSSRALEALIQALKSTIVRLKRQRYGWSSEKNDREIAPLELALEGLEMVGAATDPTPETKCDAATNRAAPEQRLPPRRRGKPRISADAPCEVVPLDPGARFSDCGAALRLVGEDVAEILGFIAAERAIRPVAVGRKNFLFAGAGAGGEILADAMILIEAAKLASLDPEAYLADILVRIRDHDPAKLDDLLPWKRTAGLQAARKAA